VNKTECYLEHNLASCDQRMVNPI